jgi:hypothetical protein
MPFDAPEPEDPHVLVGVGLPADEDATREMAAAFSDEFAQMGFDRDRLLRLFESPFYAGARAARDCLGEAEIAKIVEESLRVYGGRCLGVKDAPDGSDGREARSGQGELRLWEEGAKPWHP